MNKRKTLFRVEDWALGTVELKEDEETWQIFVSNRDLIVKKDGEFIGSGYLCAGSKAKAGDWERSWLILQKLYQFRDILKDILKEIER